MRTVTFVLAVLVGGLSLSHGIRSALADAPVHNDLALSPAAPPLPEPPAMAAAPLSDVSLVIPLVVLGLGLASALTRRLTPQIHFFHTYAGSLVLSVGSALITAATTYLSMAQHFSWYMLAAALISAATSALATYNPTMAARTGTEDAVTVKFPDDRRGAA